MLSGQFSFDIIATTVCYLLLSQNDIQAIERNEYLIKHNLDHGGGKNDILKI